MVLILDGNSEMGAQVRSNLYYLVCLWHCLGLKKSQIGWVLSEKTIFVHACPACAELPCNLSTMVTINFLAGAIIINILSRTIFNYRPYRHILKMNGWGGKKWLGAGRKCPPPPLALLTSLIVNDFSLSLVLNKDIEKQQLFLDKKANYAINGM